MTKYKELWLMRHGRNYLDGNNRRFGIWQPNSKLTFDGIAEVEEVHKVHLRGREFSYLAHSPFDRAYETAILAVPGGKWVSSDALAPCMQEEVDAWAKRKPSCFTLRSVVEIEDDIPGFLETERQWFNIACEEVLGTLRSGQSALLVGHQPHIGLFRGQFEKDNRRLDQSLPKAGIYRMFFDENDEFVQTIELSPPPFK